MKIGIIAYIITEKRTGGPVKIYPHSLVKKFNYYRSSASESLRNSFNRKKKADPIPSLHAQMRDSSTSMTGLVGTVDSTSTTIMPPPTHRVSSIESVDLGAQVILNHQALVQARRDVEDDDQYNDDDDEDQVHVAAPQFAQYQSIPVQPSAPSPELINRIPSPTSSSATTISVKSIQSKTNSAKMIALVGKQSRQSSYVSSLRTPKTSRASSKVSTAKSTTTIQSKTSSRQSSYTEIVDMVDGSTEHLPPPTPEMLLFGPPKLMNRLNLEQTDPTTSEITDSVLGQDRTGEIDDWKEVLETQLRSIRESERQRYETEREHAKLSHVKGGLQDQIEELESRMDEDRENFTELQTDGQHDMEQFRPHLDGDEHHEFTRLGAQEILESTRVTTQEDLRKDLLNRQQTLTSNLQAITTEVADVSEQERVLHAKSIEHTHNLSHLRELTKDEIVEETLRENSSDELNNKLKVANDNKHILNTETYRLEAIKNSYNAASQRQKEIIEVHQDEELRKYGQIKELQKQIENMTDVLAMKQDPDRLVPLQRQASELKSEIAAQQATNNATLQSLEQQIDQARGIDPNDVSLVNLENRLHNLNLKAAQLEKEKRDVKWKCHLLKSTIAETSAVPATAKPEVESALSRTRSIRP